MPDRLFPVQIDWKLTSDFNEPRPLNAPPEKRTHVHGAWDIAVPEKTPMMAPEWGRAYKLVQFRSNGQTHNLFWDDRKWFAFSNYFYDTFGGLIILEGDSGLTYVFTHIWAQDILDDLFREHISCHIKEETDKNGAIVSLWNMNDPDNVEAGQYIGSSGNAGFSTGSHIHLELHRRRDWLRWENRPDPAEIWPLEFSRQKDKAGAREK
jgi:murein DD-endopeptidase MepM/ murein hydrolase activator NlpD